MLAATKQRYDLFVKCFAAGMFNNATQAAIDAGYAKPGAGRQALRLSNNVYVKSEIARVKAVLARKYDVTAERVVAEYVKLGFTNMEDFTINTEDGLRLKPLSDIGRDNMAAVKSIKVLTKTEHIGRGKQKKSVEHTTLQFELHDKHRSLDALGKHLGIFAIDNLQRGTSLADIAAIFAAARSKQIESEVVDV